MQSSKISDLLNKINGAIENPAFPSISKLERDLLMQHVRTLYDELDALSLNSLSEANNTIQEKKETAVLTKRPVLRPNDNLLMKEEAPANKIVEPEKKAEAVIVKEEKVVVAKAEVKEIKVEPVIEKIEKKVQTTATSINENIKSGGSLNEKLKTSSSVEIHKKLSSKPLKELIDLNKKFVLLNELFKGNTEAYTAAIAHIDTLQDYDSAQSFINTQLIANYFWDESKQSTRMFTKLVKMKFGVE